MTPFMNADFLLKSETAKKLYHEYAAGLPIIDIHDLKAKAERITGTPKCLTRGDRVVANVIYRDGTQIDQIFSVPQR